MTELIHDLTQAGPSRPRKPAAPHPSTSKSFLNNKKRKLPPPLPHPPTTSSHASASIHLKRVAPTTRIKTLQGVSKTRSDGTKDGFGREVVFVTRKTGLGALMGRCRSLVVDEGYTSLRFHAIGAAIPQAMLLLYALLDLLPYPVGDKGMWYEIRTGSVECVDEVEAEAEVETDPSATDKGKGKGKGIQQAAGSDDGVNSDLSWLHGLGAIEENTPERRSRIKSTIQIDLHISPRPKRKSEPRDAVSSSKPETRTIPNVNSNSKRNRPSKKRRTQLAAKRAGSGETAGEPEEEIRGGDGLNEEDMMNVDDGSVGVSAGGAAVGIVAHMDDEEQEEIEV
ncbi:hypothetical protein IAU59_002271 [Kwoniella sp. CBS 9459]